ncbi:MAG TPA: NAD(P)-binding domain-containing protein [Steroidobacteraceae bacterium]
MDADITIVGAGPYGLSLAAHLRARGQSFELLGSAMESWRRYMPAGMRLKSEPFASNLWDPQRRFTLRRYCEAHSIPYRAICSPVALDTFLSYTDWFCRNAAGSPRDGKLVRLARRPGGFSLSLSDGSSLTSRRVVLATGHMPFAVIPTELEGIPAPFAVHSTASGDPGAYVGLDVTVIGAGQSALEMAALLCEAGARVRILLRRKNIVWNAQPKRRTTLDRVRTPHSGIAPGWPSVAVSELPRLYRWLFTPSKRHWHVARSYGPNGAWWLRDRVEGRVEIRSGTQVGAASVTPEGLALKVLGPQGPEEIITDRAIAATGFKVDINHLDYLEPALRDSLILEAQGIPALTAQFETSIPGLFVVGLASSPVFGPIMRFMYGAKHAAPLVARRLRAGHRRRAPAPSSDAAATELDITSAP